MRCFKKFLVLTLVTIALAIISVGCAGQNAFKASDIQSLVDSIAKDQTGVCVASQIQAQNALNGGSASIITGRLNSDNSALTLTGKSCTVTRGVTTPVATK